MERFVGIVVLTVLAGVARSCWGRLRLRGRNTAGIVLCSLAAAFFLFLVVIGTVVLCQVRVTDLSRLSARELSEISKVSVGSVDDMTVVAVEEDYQRAEMESGSVTLPGYSFTTPDGVTFSTPATTFWEPSIPRDHDLLLVRFTDRDGQVCYAEYHTKAGEEFQRGDPVKVCLFVDGHGTTSYVGEKVYRRLAEEDPGELLDLRFSREADSPASYLHRKRIGEAIFLVIYAALLGLSLFAAGYLIRRRKYLAGIELAARGLATRFAGELTELLKGELEQTGDVARWLEGRLAAMAPAGKAAKRKMWIRDMRVAITEQWASWPEDDDKE